MSVEIAVFIEGDRMPTPVEWANRIRVSGFDVEIDRDFDPKTFTGFLPCKCGGKDAGFEYFCHDVAATEVDSDVIDQIGERETIVSFVTHSDLRELRTSVIASAILCVVADGVLWDLESNECIRADKVLAWAKEVDAEISRANADTKRSGNR